MAKQPGPTWEDGMRSVRAEEMDSLRALLDDVFFEGLADIQPHAMNAENASNLRVVVKDGQVVSHIGTIRRNATLLGCPVRVASLGGVATYAAHRGNGYATALLKDNMRACRDDGVDYIMVSGYRAMYHRHGCRRVGRDWAFDLSADVASDFDDDGLEIAYASGADAEIVAAIYRCEPVRWLRPRSDLVQMIDGYVSNRPARTALIKRGDISVAFAVLQTVREKDEGRVRVLDYAGDRSALVGALGKLFSLQKTRQLSLQVTDCDPIFPELLTARGLDGHRVNVSGTTLIIHFEQLMEKLRPLFAERVGETASNGLVFNAMGDEYHVYYGGDRVVAQSRGAAAQLIFGTLEGDEEAMLKAGGKAGEVLRECLPVPGLRYGVNYV